MQGTFEHFHSLYGKFKEAIEGLRPFELPLAAFYYLERYFSFTTLNNAQYILYVSQKQQK